jgi:hypothetical protein
MAANVKVDDKCLPAATKRRGFANSAIRRQPIS